MSTKLFVASRKW